MTYTFIHSLNNEKMIEIPAIGLGLRVPLGPHASGGAVTVIETVNAPGFGPPLHRHPQAEVFRVIEGRYLYVCDDKEFEAGQGDVVSIPGGAAHTFMNITDRPARQFILIIPSLDAVSFFVGLGEVMRDGVPSAEILAGFGRKWDIEFLGPPLKRK